jgi:hypothetical protein
MTVSPWILSFASSQPTQKVAHEARLLMELTSQIRKPIQIPETLPLTRCEPGEVEPLASCLTRQQLAELFPVFRREAGERITRCLLVIRGTDFMGHLSVSVQDLLVRVALTGRTILEPIHEVL